MYLMARYRYSIEVILSQVFFLIQCRLLTSKIRNCKGKAAGPIYKMMEKNSFCLQSLDNNLNFFFQDIKNGLRKRNEIRSVF